jgi:hypothetical protein
MKRMVTHRLTLEGMDYGSMMAIGSIDSKVELMP